MSKEKCVNNEIFSYFLYTVDDVLLVATIPATIITLLVILSAIQLFKRKGDTMHIFILNMSMGDIIISSICLPHELISRKHENLDVKNFNQSICFLRWIGFAVSGLSLILLNIDKLIFFRWPFYYNRWMSESRAKIFCLTIWITVVAIVTYCWLFNLLFIFHQDYLIEMSPLKKFYYEIFTLLFCIIPAFSSFIVSIYLFFITKEKRNLDGAGKRKFRQKIKSMAFIFATTMWTTFSLSPFRMFNILRIHFISWKDTNCYEKKAINWIAWILFYILSLNPIINSLITSLIYAPYRAAIREFFNVFTIKNSNNNEQKSYESDLNIVHVEYSMRERFPSESSSIF